MNDEKLKNNVVNMKEYVVAMPKKRKIIIGVVAGLLVLFAIAITFALNNKEPEYRVLYQNIDSAEASQVYQSLTELGAKPQLNTKGEVTVPSSEYDIWLLRLAEKGFPKTALTYDIFSDHSSMTSTESERQQWLIYQLQDRIQETLRRITGVSNAVVTITMPEKSDYIWDQATKKERGTASVLLTLNAGQSLEATQVTAVKNLIAAGVPQMDPSDVTVVDASTLEEFVGEDEENGISTTQNMKFEQTVQAQIEENILRLLTPRYGEKGVVAVAKATINYDKMITESMQLQENPEGGGGFPTHTGGEFTLNNGQTLGGIVGETDNTDIPQYSYNSGGGQDETYYSWDTDIDYSYIKTQIEKGNAVLERATVSVMVEEPILTIEREEELINLISKSVDIAPELIFVSALNTPVEEPIIVEEPDVIEVEKSFFESLPIWAYIIAVVLLIIIISVIILVVKRKRKLKRLQEEEEARIRAEEEAARLENEISAYKKQLSEGANSETAAKDEAIMEEVRDFAKLNPEITANLLRSWLREEE